MTNPEMSIKTVKFPDFQGHIITIEPIVYDLNKEPVYVKALWDTGATYTSISAELVKKLGLNSDSQFLVEDLTNKYYTDSHIIYILINNQDVFKIKAACSPTLYKKSGADILLGMDFIGQGDFAFYTEDGVKTFTFRIPSQGIKDFT